MAFYDYLPKFHQIEVNNLKGLQPGFVIAQLPVADSLKNTLIEKKFMENGMLCTISADGIVAATPEKPVFLHYTEPLNTIYDAPRFFAVNVENEYPRLVQLIPGDEWMTDYEYDAEELAELGIVLMDGKKFDDWFDVDKLADGTPAHHYMYIGKVVSTVAEAGAGEGQSSGDGPDLG